MVAGGHCASVTSEASISCRSRSVHLVQGALGRVTPTDHFRGLALVGLAGVGAFMCDFTARVTKFASPDGEKSMTKQPGWVVVSFQFTVIAAPAVSVLCGCDAASLIPQGAPVPGGVRGGS